mmetsp:Transcript_29940/g.96609  ORF Transcript_29940/g.96609 Transcript_29940/m.96609 type:complete len:108 (+) Transcript_29940:108-431(+)
MPGKGTATSRGRGHVAGQEDDEGRFFSPFSLTLGVTSDEAYLFFRSEQRSDRRRVVGWSTVVSQSGFELFYSLGEHDEIVSFFASNLIVVVVVHLFFPGGGGGESIK